MRHQRSTSPARLLFVLATACGLGACTVSGSARSSDGSDAAPPPVIEHQSDGSSLVVDRPERFPLATASSHLAAPTLTANGVISPDISRAVPVVSLASGRAVDLRVRLGDYVEKGQLLMRVHSADVASAAADYHKAVADQGLARAQLDRAGDLYERGAIARKDLEIAQDAAAKADVDVQNTAERLRVFGVDPAAGPSGGIIDVVAPASGVITEQNVTSAAGVKTLDNSPNLFTISDLSRLWILCDVHENDLPAVRVGDPAEIHIAAYPERALSGRIDNIAPILDPNIRTAKVRIEIGNPGILRIGMFVTAVFHGQTAQARTVVPASAILHLHDREWVYVSGVRGRFERREVVSGPPGADGGQELISGLQPGERVAADALTLQNSVE